ncbi:MAG: exodeoxyribonuclease VII large subunit [Pseudomonadales bacterium]|jgi:exodeoxyribonuclease VII large subunit|nr:exodeoxyribonuclease VII large subunit [Pseudomonadales bacterium]
MTTRRPPLADDPPPATLLDTPRRVLTPSQLNAEAQVALEEAFGVVWVEGELSNFARPSSGHWYFTLKDRQAQVRCAMFRNRNGRVRFRPEDGMHVLLRGRVSLYVGRGEFQLIVDAIEPAGEGALRLAFEQLRQRLAAEGLFEDDRKRPLPACPRHIALITSPTGAAIRDLVSVLGRRWPVARVTLLPTAVQGEQAGAEIAAAFARLERWVAAAPEDAPDLVIAGRGGGSLEDLWAFNEEAVARALAGCSIPVVSAVGHETDFTIADFVADLRAPTPSAAAELATPDQSDWRAALARGRERLRQRLVARLANDRRHLDQVRRRLRHPGALLQDRIQRADELELRLRRLIAQRGALLRTQLDGVRRRLRAQSPVSRVARDGERLAALRRRLERSSPALLAARDRARVAQARARLTRAAQGRITKQQQRLRGAQTALTLQNPLGVVDRGYALLTRPAAPGQRFGALVRSPDEVSTGDALHAHLAGGVLAVAVVGPLDLSTSGDGAEEDGRA